MFLFLHLQLGLLYSTAHLVTVGLTFTHASLSASWRISLHIVPNDLLNSESSYYYYYYYCCCYCCCCYCYCYTASCIISLWEEYHSIPHPPHGKVIPLQDHTLVMPLALGSLGAFKMVCMASVETHAHHFKKKKKKHFGKCCTCRLKCCSGV